MIVRAMATVAVSTAIVAAVSACAQWDSRLRANDSVRGNDIIGKPFAPSADATRGREVFTQREQGHCVLCHDIPGVERAGNVGPSLAGVGKRLTPSQIRLRVADITRVYPESVMPTFHRVDGLVRVAPQYRGKPALDSQQVEDLVAFLSSLQ